MSEVLIEYERPVTHTDGTAYRARACGREREDGHWEGWIEFVPSDDSPVLRSARETTQPNRVDTEYWATGLSAVYLEGSLRRTLDPRRPVHAAAPGKPAYDGPAPPPGAGTPNGDDGDGHAILDPYSVRSNGGEELLRQELSALRGWHLKNIVRGHGLAGDEVDLDDLGAAELIDLIVLATRPAAEKAS